jgi:uncharacterized YigZ family protein
MEQREHFLREGQYLSIEAPVDYEISIKRSRFIASLRNVSDRGDFDEAYKEIISKYPKATHYCWAYRFAGTAPLEHSSDAGEPSGSAGRPILGSLKKHALLNIMAIVTRYYGGIKLGMPGLISAYGEATALAVKESIIVVREPMSVIDFKCSYDLYNIFLEIAKRHNVSDSGITANFEEIIFGELLISNYNLNSITSEFDKMTHCGSLFEYSTRKS